MAVYDIDATPASAVTAFLAQFAIAANGTITYVSGSDTFHVNWLHRALQKKVWDFTTDTDDLVSLDKPNPSTSEAIGTIITLEDHTADYSVRYNIDATVAQYLFGGSVEQDDGAGNVERWSGLIVLGSVSNSATVLQILQNNGLLTEFWGQVNINQLGWNQTDGSTLLRVLVKTYDGASGEIDNSVVNVKASHWGDTYANWTTTLGLGESVAAINTFSDPQNDTTEGTVNGWTAIATQLEGIDLIDVDGNGNKEFLGTLNYTGIGNGNKKSIYERVKSMFAYNTTNTPWGFDGDLWTARVFDCDNLTAGSGTWVQNEQVTWGAGATAGSGTLMGVANTAGGSNTRLVLHLETGVAPDASVTLTGAGGASQAMSQASTGLVTNPNWIGTFTGSAWIAAFGVGFEASQLEFGDSVTSLDDEKPTIPQNVAITVNVTVPQASDDAHVFLAEALGNAPDYAKYTAVGGEVATGTSVDVGTIDADEPKTGYIGVKHNSDTAYTFYEYTDWNTGTFTLGGTLNSGQLQDSIAASDEVFIAYFYESATGGGVNKSVSRSFVFDAGTRNFVGWVRLGDPAAPGKPVNIAFNNVGSNSVSQNVTLSAE